MYDDVACSISKVTSVGLQHGGAIPTKPMELLSKSIS
jgi:hypothetical protein